MLVKEFSKMLGITNAAVSKRLKANNPYKSIKAFRKMGNTWLIEIEPKEFSKHIVKNEKKKLNK
jgi:predicted transcriptional regulator